MAHSIELRTYIVQRILLSKRKGKSYCRIVDILGEEGHTVTKSGMCSFLKRYKERESIRRKPGTDTKSKKNSNFLKLVDSYRADDKASL